MDLTDCFIQRREYLFLYSKVDESLFSDGLAIFTDSSTGSQYLRKRLKGNSNARIFVHRLIMGLTQGDSLEVDHINHNGLDNRRCNLRVCTRQQNARNRRGNNGTSSQFKGVHFAPRLAMWVAACDRKTLGYFSTELEAALAYDEAAIRLHGEFAYLNFPEAAASSVSK